MAKNKDNLGPVFGEGLRKASGKDLGDVLEKEITDEMFKDDGIRKRRCKSSKINKKSIRRSSQFSSAMILTPDWTSLDQFSPYYSAKDDKYYITIPTVFETTGDQRQKEIIFNEAKEMAAESLAEVYNKQNPLGIKKQIIDVAEAIDYFIPPRPNPKCGPNGETIPLFGVKVLVTVPAAIFDKFPLNQEGSTNACTPPADLN